ncbi:hypothetical protein KDJ56_11170 [Brevibacillus composti]|uniref:Uncharacterized protein n=1 Tax=Brevibacillus composti TaxID=2796470 RepID=A0ABX7Z8M2_9BACL|nr:hypothetical protein [Brevibacillus composti]QUO43461.1 hypothetical protein KDJ56_11170 [Brevibacillus composti]
MFQQIRVGNVVVASGLKELDVWRSRKDPAGYASFLFKDEVEIDAPQGAIVEIDIGYDETNAARVFTGYVSRPDQERIIAKDSMTKLLQTKVMQSFLQATPQDMIRFGLKLAGIEVYSIAEQIFSPRNQVVANLNVYDMIRQRINPYWNIDFAPHFDVRDVFVWQPLTRSDEMFLFQYGENIIEMLADGEIGMFRTVFVPELDHSQYIMISHPQVNGIALVETVHHFIQDDKLRSEIYYKLESE